MCWKLYRWVMRQRYSTAILNVCCDARNNFRVECQITKIVYELK